MKKLLLKLVLKLFDKGEAQKELIDYLSKDLFNIVSEDDVIRLTRQGSFFYKGKQLPLNEAQDLRDLAINLQQSQIWKLLINEARLAANKKMFHNSKNEYDILFGKAMLVETEVMEKSLKKISNVA